MVRIRRRLAPVLLALFLVPIPGAASASEDLSARDGGYNYTCATDSAGTASCWGLSTHGQASPPSEAFKQMSAGLYHGCGVTIAGSIVCWGNPIIRALDPPPGTYKEVAAGHDHTCAIRTNNTIVCWVTQPDIQPILNEPAGEFHGLAAGTGSSCALNESDHITCWGGSVIGAPPSGAFESIIVGADFGCGLRSDGTVDCWGARPDPVDGGFAAIAGGGTAWCGLKSDGSIQCASNPHEWGPFTLTGPFDMLAVEWQHVCGRRLGGAIECDSYASPDPGIEPRVISATPPTGIVGQQYQHTILPTDMYPWPTWSVTAGSLPAGLTLGSGGSITGSPTAVGSSQVTIHGSNGIAPAIDHDLTIEVASPPPPTDTTPPTATGPSQRLLAGASISSGRVSLRLTWSGSDAGSGMARYELMQSTDGGAWTSVSTTLTSPTLDRSLAPGHSYRFRLRAVDGAGNVGAWLTAPTFRLTHHGELASSVRYSGTWSTSTNPMYWGSRARRSDQAGARATLTATGRSYAWVARTGPDRGKAQVYVNGVLKATVDLYSPSYHNQRVVWSGAWAASASRTISIRVLGTSGRPRVEVDAFVVGS